MTLEQEVKALHIQVRALQGECGALLKQLTAAREGNYMLREQIAALKKRGDGPLKNPQAFSDRQKS